MALDPAQQFMVDMENLRNTNQIAADARRAKLESVRLAKEVLLENSRSKPVDARDVTAADITVFAAALEAHINA